jgi:peptidoglycan/LPS O-acetylase OafA/YrhL
MPTGNLSKVSRFESLDGMRGVCAVFVAIYHFDTVLNTGHLLNHGWLSVDVFFVLSGFVIARAHEERLRARRGFIEFLRARAARLLPVQIVGTIVAGLSIFALYRSGHLAMAHLTAGALFVGTIWTALLIPNSLSPVGEIFAYWNRPFPVNPPLWSLQAEWIVNIVYARLLYATRTSTLLAIFCGLALYLFDHSLHAPDGWDATVHYEFFPSTGRALLGFMAGAIIFRAYTSDLLDRMPSIRPEFVFSLWFLICAVPSPRAIPIFESAAAILFAPLAVAVLVRGERPLNRIYSWLGKLSYPLYASHFAIVTLSGVWLDQNRSRHSALYAIPMLIAGFILAWGIERLTTPWMQIKRERFPINAPSVEVSEPRSPNFIDK